MVVRPLLLLLVASAMASSVVVAAASDLTRLENCPFRNISLDLWQNDSDSSVTTDLAEVRVAVPRSVIECEGVAEGGAKIQFRQVTSSEIIQNDKEI